MGEIRRSFLNKIQMIKNYFVLSKYYKNTSEQQNEKNKGKASSAFEN